MFSLLNAGLWPWIAAASVPLVIHLLTRRTRRRMDLPTVKFLQRTLAHQSRIFRWRHWLLLALRTLAIAALVVAFLRPALLSPLAAQGFERSGVVIVLDVSESMAYSSGGVSSLAKAKSQALSVLQDLRAGDHANIVFCGAQPTSAQPSPTTDIAALQTSVRSMEATDERADAASAINVAVEQLGKTNSRAKRLYIISDFQRTNWSDVKFDAVPADARVLFVSVDSTARQNAGLTGLKIRPSTPCVGEPLTVQAEVFNSSSSPRTVPVTFTLSDPSAPLGTGSRNFSDSVQLAPYSSGNVSLPLTFDAPQRMECTATLPQDNLAGDNTRRLVIDLGRMATVLLITDEDTNATTSAAYYLVRALHPDPGSVAGFRVLPVHSNAVNNPMLKAADAVMVCNAPSMPPVQLEVLAKYAVSGGSLVWFLYGDRVAEQIKGLSAQLPKSEPAPLQVEGIANVQSRAKGFVTLSEARYESKLLKAFRDLTASDLGHIKFYKFSLTSEVQPRAELLLKFEDGTAAAVRCGEGSGNLLLLNMSPAPSWSDLARQQIFLPLMHEFLKGILAKDSGALEAFPGGTASTTIEPTSATLTCVDPLGQVVPVTMDKTTGSIVIDPARRAGIYHLTAGAQEVAALAVNPHPDESDLRSIDPRELESQREKSRSYLTGSTGNDPDVSDLDKGTPIWHYLLIFAIAALFAEQAVGRVGVRSRKGKTA